MGIDLLYPLALRYTTFPPVLVLLADDLSYC